ncbi:uncharacterized protein J3R85_008023 [Psidium guajava]|nr:uncharacterized protein J3R85_008023 [Psidium guajava]
MHGLLSRQQGLLLLVTQQSSSSSIGSSPGTWCPPDSGECRLIEAHQKVNLRDLNAIFTRAVDELEVERRRGEALEEMRRVSQRQCWWEAPILGVGGIC